VLVAGIRRLAVIYASVLVVTVAVSAALGLSAGASVGRAIAVGLYCVGAVTLVGCFVFGIRGPLRGASATGDPTPIVGARRLRTATRDERSEATRISILLFVVGLSFVVLGSIVDPARSTF
jgi:hypothetical protein